ncbi:MAG: hypothetical protein M3Z05_05495 [Gemmatimonadota bacterium]|nr:hypothetical protein [Gemmatimonadota bacterium]
MWARTLARYGVNCVRLHFLDLDAPRGIIAAGTTDSRRFDPQQLDRLDFLVAELKKRGIEVGKAPPERYAAEMSFISDIESNFYVGMASFLRDSLRVKAPITGTADHGHSGASYPMRASLSKLDIMDGHVYWEHPGSPPPVNTPMVNDPLHSTVVQLSRTAVAGKPYTVSEFNHPFPNDWASEGIPILAAYGALQDWDAIILYTFGPTRDAAWQSYVGDPFDISLDPVRMTEMATGALMFLRGDVKPAMKTVTQSYSRDQTFDSRRLGRGPFR